MYEVVSSLIYKNLLLSYWIYLALSVVISISFLAFDFYILSALVSFITFLFLIYKYTKIQSFLKKHNDFLRDTKVNEFYLINSIMIFEDSILCCDVNYKLIMISDIERLSYSDSVFERIKRVESASKYITVHCKSSFIQIQVTKKEDAQKLVNFFVAMNQEIETSNIRANCDSNFYTLSNLYVNTRY